MVGSGREVSCSPVGACYDCAVEWYIAVVLPAAVWYPVLVNVDVEPVLYAGRVCCVELEVDVLGVVYGDGGVEP